MDAEDPITNDSLEVVFSLCFRIALFAKIENVPGIIDEMTRMVRKMRQVVLMRKQGTDTSEIIRAIKLPNAGDLLKIPVHPRDRVSVEFSARANRLLNS